MNPHPHFFVQFSPSSFSICEEEEGLAEQDRSVGVNEVALAHNNAAIKHLYHELVRSLHQSFSSFPEMIT